MKIALLGGSFNPIHIGHLALADEVCTALGYDRLLFVPAWKAPHKEARETVAAKARLEMVRCACTNDERFCAEPCEIERGGTSYTYDTICQLEKKYENVLDAPLGLVIGEDLFPGFHLWYRASDIAQKTQLILAVRPSGTEKNSAFSNIPTGKYQELFASTFDVEKEPLFLRAIRLQNPSLELSSTEIRARIAEGRSFRYLVPPLVFEYIRKERLYERNRQ